MKQYFYVFIRKDIHLVNQIIQASHVCFEVGQTLNFKTNEPASMVLFQVNNEKELREIGDYLDWYIPSQYCAFYESDYPIGLNAICTIPFDEDDPKRKLFEHFELYRNESVRPIFDY